MLQGRKVLTMNVRAEESNLNSNVDRWEGRIAGRTITHFLTLKTMQGGGDMQYAKSVLSQNPYINLSKLANVAHAVLSSSS